MGKLQFESSLPTIDGSNAPSKDESKAVSHRRKLAWALIPLTIGYLTFSRIYTSLSLGHSHPVNYTAQCVQPPALFPRDTPELAKAFVSISSPSFINTSIERLSGAVKIKTETFDDLGDIGVDKRWDVFYGFHEYLEKTFPLVHEKLKVEKVNTHGLLYTWQGSNPDLKPTTLMAHQDTVPVPVDTIPVWEHPPWSGHYDGKYIWGRGSSDCKNQLIATLSTIDLLLSANFIPKRTILLSYGFDEETFGYHGAGNISAVLHERYGDDGLAVVVDEGAGFEEAWGTVFAKPGAAEKGSTNVEITVRTPGGHSSIPRDHTSIGILSEMVYLIESTQYPTRLYDENPYYTQLQCGAAYAPDFDPKIKKLLNRRLKSGSSESFAGGDMGTCAKKHDELALEAAKQGPEIKYLLQTSQAVDIISGGAKVNALPERARAIVNHRINVGETAQVIFDHLTKVAAHVARKHNLTLNAFTSETPSSITLAHNDVLPPAPVSASSPHTPYSILASTNRAIYGDDIITTPGIMTGNTDTRYFWALTKHIFRFAPGYDAEGDEGLGNIHTVNERVSVTAHVNTVKWFVTFLRNMDDADFES
ncbi:related to CPS1-gly-X carboxypeptidase YSCS precursor [Rhynchosporium secalis]|uniref:Related to CPS1-gly-X carboxypeptidase YSCS n=1 Tax=Rhynchosporium secalis TaxID=38038 RepID=A0A1E1M1E1_RHYSE|nr:related to CPS1-gly-X carboxypeptidase YSCS precursor [Rhynchosporium secalis]